jgi:hypothetical protein
MPALLRLAREALPRREEVEELGKTVAAALASAEAAGYRIDVLLGPLAATDVRESAAPEPEPEPANTSVPESDG